MFDVDKWHKEVSDRMKKEDRTMMKRNKYAKCNEAKTKWRKQFSERMQEQFTEYKRKKELGIPIGDSTSIPGDANDDVCLLYTSPSPRDRQKSRMPSSA